MQKKFRHLIVVGFLLAVMAVCPSCAAQDADNRAKTSERDDEMENVKLSEDEIQILVSAGFSESRIRSGTVTSVDRGLLRAYSFAKESLEVKYPEDTLEILRCSAFGKGLPYTEFHVEADGDSSRTFDLYVSYDEEADVYSSEDNYFGYQFSGKYADYILPVIQNEFPQCVSASVWINNVYGADYNSSLTVETLIENDMYLVSDITLYLNGDDIPENEYRAVSDGIQKLLADRNIYGGHRIYILPASVCIGRTAEDIQDYINENSESAYYYKENFNVSR